MATSVRCVERWRRLSRECRTVQRRLVFFEDLPAAEAADVLTHLDACPDCARIERLVRSLLATLRHTPIPEPDDRYWDRLA
jgi:hypothetical protein